MARRGGNRFDGPRARPPDRFDRPLRRAGGAHAPRARRPGDPVGGSYPDLLEHWDRTQTWTPWRRGMALAFNSLLRDRRQFQAATVLHLPAFQPQRAWRAASALLCIFPSSGSPEGRWTVTVKPRGTEISPRPLRGAEQRLVVNAQDSQLPERLLVVDVTGAWEPGALASASTLIGELVEDTAVSATAVTDENDEAVILMCVAVYPELGQMVFDATRRWRRFTSERGSVQLREEAIEAPAVPYFRSGRHLTQSTTLSCNCPSALGLEYALLRPGSALGSQRNWPRGAPESLEAGGDLMEGVARRIFRLDWRRDPLNLCKHAHAARFALGCPVAEPDGVPSPASDYWDGLHGMLDVEELRAPLAHPRFLEAMNRRTLLDLAWARLDSTLLVGSVGDAFGVVPDRLQLVSEQVSASELEETNTRRRFNLQVPLATPEQGEEAVFGDVWAGRGTAVIAKPYVRSAEVLDAPFVEDLRGELQAVYG